MFHATRFKQTWVVVIKQALSLGQYLSSPYWRPLDALSGCETEILALHISRLQAQHKTIRADKVIQGRWLLVASSDSYSSVLSLWSLSSILWNQSATAHLDPLTETYLGGPVGDGRVIVDSESIVIAVDIRSPDPWLEILSLTTHNDQPAFTRIAHLPGSSRIRCMDKHFVGFALYNEISVPCLLHWSSGTVIRLNQKPHLTGGCVAMAIAGSLVAVVSPHLLELFTVTTSSPYGAQKLYEWKTMDYFSGAALIFNNLGGLETQPRSPQLLRLCIAEKEALHLFELKVTDIASVHQGVPPELSEVWERETDPGTDMYHPRFGLGPTTLTWFKGPGEFLRSVAFVTCQVPLQASTVVDGPDKTSPYEFTDDDMPALYCMGVRDYDETRGILALGNSFGELAVYDFSGSNALDLEGCFSPVSFPAASSQEIMPRTPIPSTAALPYPYSGSYRPARGSRTSVLASWRPYQPDPCPDGWDTTFTRPNTFIVGFEAPWTSYVAALGSAAWRRENALHYFGIQRPIMHREETQDTNELVVFRAGGLLFFDYRLGTSLHVMEDNDLSADDIVRVFNRELQVPTVERQCGDMTMDNVRRRFLSMRRWEVSRGKDRWKELKERGGEVDLFWLRGY